MQFGALGTVTRRHWIELTTNTLSSRKVLRGLTALESMALLVSKSSMKLARRARSPALQRRVEAYFSSRGRHFDRNSHFGKLARLEAEARGLVKSRTGEMEPVATPRGAPHPNGAGGNRTDFWNRYFETEDPWNYGSPYEQEKYERQLEILPDGPIGRALELACAEGHFTRQLAPRVDHLIATDISAVALSRARARCGDHPNVEFRVLDFASDVLPEKMDLIFCSEALYYFDDVAELQPFATKIANALVPGGSFISAHAFVLSDNMERTGFDWDNKFGAEVISRMLAASQHLHLDQSIQTDLYRIDRFRRASPEVLATEPSFRHVPIRAPIETEVERNIIRGGARALRRNIQREERRQRIPVLMYHGVCDDGPKALARYRVAPAEFESQMRWLRSNGFHAIASEQLEWFIVNHHPFVGRPVLITFDDGFQNFADHATQDAGRSVNRAGKN